ncbi:hypothetical protein B0H16DRAFT_1883199 [Mycena metata]|uniref:Uncharacterized protein n=1 Tax=Mycena metata TaxID=1033252 RepID=A0AAD7JIX5_9AGAR|nr:hypothetical protein B0H16DRAFT_1883199 [Mycena metata]
MYQMDKSPQSVSPASSSDAQYSSLWEQDAFLGIPRICLTTGAGRITLQRLRGAWDYRPRRSNPRPLPRAGNLPARAQNWVSIPDAHLPQPWSCNWRRWPFATTEFDLQSLESGLAASYARSSSPLTPVVFEDHTTVFGCAGTGRYYLCYGLPLPLRPAEPGIRPQWHQVYAFEGVFPSLDAFIENADWNRVERVNPVGEADKALVTSNIAPALPLGSGRGFRIAAQEPYQKRTLWDMCPPPETFGHVPRNTPRSSLKKGKFVNWAQIPIPDSELPEPWSADWDTFVPGHKWYSEMQVELEERFGRALMGFVPALFSQEDYREDIVICPPGGAGTYYLWGDSWRWDTSPPDPMPEMQRFRGVFANVDHFVRAGDWNPLEKVVECPNSYSS